MKLASITLAAAALALSATAAFADPAGAVKNLGTDVGHRVAQTGRATGHEAAKVGREAGHAVAQTGRDIAGKGPAHKTATKHAGKSAAKKAG